jgi:hypothetical protein
MCNVVWGGPPFVPADTLVVLCGSVDALCCGADGVLDDDAAAAGAREVEVLENVGELVCEGWRETPRVSSRRGAAAQGAGVRVGAAAGICTGSGSGTAACGSGVRGSGVAETGCCETGAGAGSRFITIKAITVASTAPRTKVITGFISSPVC